MSDADRSNQADDDTVVRQPDDALPSAEAAAKPASRPRLADRLMGRTGPKAQNSSTAAKATDKDSTEARNEGRAPSSPARPKTSESDIQPTGSAASAIPAPPTGRQATGGAHHAQADVPTVLSAGPVVGTARPDFAAGVPTTVSTASRENSPVGVLQPQDPALHAEDAGAQSEGGEETDPKRESFTKGRPSTRRTRKARLRLASVDPWSVMKMAFLFSMAAGIALVVAVMVIWFVIGQSGLFDAVNQAVNDALSAPGDNNSFDLSRFVSGGRVIGSAMVLAVIDVLLLTALATVGAFLYNLGATLLGGFEVTLADD